MPALGSRARATAHSAASRRPRRGPSCARRRQAPAAAAAAGGASRAPSAAISAEPSGESATLVFFNRPIVVLRARVLGRGPAERAEGAARALDDLVGAAHHRDRSNGGPFDGGALITVGSRGVLALTAPDVDELSGETLEDADAPRPSSVCGRRSTRRRKRIRRALLLRSGAPPRAAVAAGAAGCCGASRVRAGPLGRRLVAIAERTVARARDRRRRRAPRLAAARRRARGRDGAVGRRWISS